MKTTREVADIVGISLQHTKDWLLYLPVEIRPVRGASRNKCGWAWNNRAIKGLEIVRDLKKQCISWQDIKAHLQKEYDEGRL